MFCRYLFAFTRNSSLLPPSIIPNELVLVHQKHSKTMYKLNRDYNFFFSFFVRFLMPNYIGFMFSVGTVRHQQTPMVNKSLFLLPSKPDKSLHSCISTQPAYILP